MFLKCVVEDSEERIVIYRSLANCDVRFNTTELEGDNDVFCVLSKVCGSKGIVPAKTYSIRETYLDRYQECKEIPP